MFKRRVPDGWVSLREHLEAVGVERDRRYAEVAIEREKALRIKETADLAALQLAREIQTYKDEKANELREQINRERVLYASKDDLGNVSNRFEAMIKPLADFVSAQQGGSQAVAQNRTDRRLNLGQVLVVVSLVLAAAGLFFNALR